MTCWVLGKSSSIQGSGFRVQSAGFRVQGSGVGRASDHSDDHDEEVQAVPPVAQIRLGPVD